MRDHHPSSGLGARQDGFAGACDPFGVSSDACGEASASALVAVRTQQQQNNLESVALAAAESMMESTISARNHAQKIANGAAIELSIAVARKVAHSGATSSSTDMAPLGGNVVSDVRTPPAPAPPPPSAQSEVAAEQTFAEVRSQEMRVTYELQEAGTQSALDSERAESLKWREEVDRMRHCVASAEGEVMIASAIEAAPMLAHESNEVEKLRHEISQRFGEEAADRHAGVAPIRRHSSNLMKAFLGIVLAYAGPRALGFITQIIPGATVDTVKQWRANAPSFMMGMSDAAIEHNLETCVIPAIYELGLQSVGWLLAEDGTSAQKRIDIQVETVAGAVRAVAYGLNGEPFPVDSVAKLAEAVKRRGLATTIYVIMLVPLVQGAPALPIVVDANDNTFTRADVHRVTSCILRALADRGLRGRVRGGVSDGDPKLRAQQLALQFHQIAAPPAESYLDIDHEFVQQLRLPMISGSFIISHHTA
jgi:hypothetical protein